MPAVPARFSRGSIAGMSSAMAPSIAGPRRWMAAAISASVKSARCAAAGPAASAAARTPASEPAEPRLDPGATGVAPKLAAPDFSAPITSMCAAARVGPQAASAPASEFAEVPTIRTGTTDPTSPSAASRCTALR